MTNETLAIAPSQGLIKQVADEVRASEPPHFVAWGTIVSEATSEKGPLPNRLTEAVRKRLLSRTIQVCGKPSRASSYPVHYKELDVRQRKGFC